MATTTTYYGTRLSEHISKTPEGFLIAHDVPLCRTAERVPMIYRGSEMGLNTDDAIEVYRSANEVMHPKHLASLEGKPIVEGHAGGFVDADNAGWRARGHAQNIRKGGLLPNGEQCVLGDVVVTDATLAQKVLDGQLREVSTGYSCEYVPLGDGSYEQRKLRANHIAVVRDGRAGEHVRIYDAALIRTFAEMIPTEDGLSEAMLRGEPHSWDEIAAAHQQMTLGEEMPLTKKERDTLLQNILSRLEGLANTDEGEEMEATDESPLLLFLRKIKPTIQASGNVQAIDAYNTAVRAIKREQRRVLAVDTRTPAERVADAAQWTRLQAEVNGESFAESARNAGARMRGELVAEEKRPTRARTQDSPMLSDEDWSSAHRDAGRKLRNKKH